MLSMHQSSIFWGGVSSKPIVLFWVAYFSALPMSASKDIDQDGKGRRVDLEGQRYQNVPAVY